MSSRRRDIITGVLLGLVLLLTAAPLWADDERPGGGDIVLGSNADAATGDVSNVVRDRALALGLGGSDMDLRDNYRTYSVLFGLWQDSKVNLLALARDLAAEGNHEAAAALRCTPRAVRAAFGGRDQCIAVLERPPVYPFEITETLDEHEEDEEEYHAEGIRMYEELAARVDELAEEAAKPPPAPRPQVIRETVVEQRPLLTEEQLDALRIKK